MGGSLFGLGLSSQAAWAQVDDPGLIRGLETDSASVENAFYLWTAFNNDSSPYHGVYLYGEGIFDLGRDWGLETDFPTLLTKTPLGEVPVVLGPIGFYARWEPLHFGGWDSDTAGVLSLKAGGAYGASNDVFPRVGSSWTLEVLGGYRVGPLFFQGNYGYTGGLDTRVAGQWKANTDIGCGLGSDWYVQAETDFSLQEGAKVVTSWAVIPQVAFQPDEWLFEIGESLNGSPAGTTEILAARTF